MQSYCPSLITEASPMISDELLAILQCPETKQPLQVAEGALIADLNRQIGAKSLVNRLGQTVETKLDGGLIRDDGACLFPIVDGIPIMLVDESIPLEKAET